MAIIIYHITPKAEWHSALRAGNYVADSLAREGFIHCSTAQQVPATANRLYQGRRNLVLLCIETAKLSAEIRYENLAGGADLFPHVYGAIETDAVFAVHEFAPLSSGCFELPPAIGGR